MKKLMVLVVLLAVALIAAPAIAQLQPTEPPPGEAPGDGSGAPFQKGEPSPPVAPAPAAPPSVDPGSAAPPPAEPALETPVPVIPSDDGGPVPGTGDGTIPGPGDVTTTDAGPDVGEGPGGGISDEAIEDDAVEDTDDEIAENGILEDDALDAEDEEDEIVGGILDDLEDENGDEDEDAADEDGVEQDNDQDVESGDVDQDVDIINTGDNVNQCVAVLQVANTGNAVNNNGVVQVDNEDAEVELEDGSSISITPRLVIECRQVIMQVARSEQVSDSDARQLRNLLRPRSGAQIVRTGGIPNRVANLPGRVNTGAAVRTNRPGAAATPRAASASRAGQPKASALRLPRTGGGYAVLLGVGGVLLIGGGLVVRRLAR